MPWFVHAFLNLISIFLKFFQGGRFIGYHYFGGKEAALKAEEKKQQINEVIAASNATQ